MTNFCHFSLCLGYELFFLGTVEFWLVLVSRVKSENAMMSSRQIWQFMTHFDCNHQYNVKCIIRHRLFMDTWIECNHRCFHMVMIIHITISINGSKIYVYFLSVNLMIILPLITKQHLCNLIALIKSIKIGIIYLVNRLFKEEFWVNMSGKLKLKGSKDRRPLLMLQKMKVWRVLKMV